MPSNPEVRIKEGERINFHVDATGHPFYIKTTNTTGTGDLVSGVTNNGATDGTVTWTPPGGSAGTYYYKCGNHAAMGGVITVVGTPVPPGYIVNLTASDNNNYTLDGDDRNGVVSGNDVDVTIKEGDRINFIVDAAGHPLYLKIQAGSGTGNQIAGVTNQGDDDGIVYWTAPAGSAGTYYYQCGNHAAMSGRLIVTGNSQTGTPVYTGEESNGGPISEHCYSLNPSWSNGKLCVRKAGPYFLGSGPIKFSKMRQYFKEIYPVDNTVPISASELKRVTNVLERDPIVPDSVENENIASVTEFNWKCSQFRGSVKRYWAHQTGTVSQFDMGRFSGAAGIDWCDMGINGRDSINSTTGNHPKNIQKHIYIKGVCYSSHSGTLGLMDDMGNGTDKIPAARLIPSEPNNNVVPANNVRIYVENTASIYGSAGTGGYDNIGGYENGAPKKSVPGKDGGTALKIQHTGESKTDIFIQQTAKIWGGGGSGEQGEMGDLEGTSWDDMIGTCGRTYPASPSGTCGDDPTCDVGDELIDTEEGAACPYDENDNPTGNAKTGTCEKLTDSLPPQQGIGGKGGDGAGWGYAVYPGGGPQDGQSGSPGTIPPQLCPVCAPGTGFYKRDGKCSSPGGRGGDGGTWGSDGGSTGEDDKAPLNDAGKGGAAICGLNPDTGAKNWEVGGYINDNTLKGKYTGDCVGGGAPPPDVPGAPNIAMDKSQHYVRFGDGGNGTQFGSSEASHLIVTAPGNQKVTFGLIHKYDDKASGRESYGIALRGFEVAGKVYGLPITYWGVAYDNPKRQATGNLGIWSIFMRKFAIFPTDPYDVCWDPSDDMCDGYDPQNDYPTDTLAGEATYEGFFGGIVRTDQPTFILAQADNFAEVIVRKWNFAPQNWWQVPADGSIPHYQDFQIAAVAPNSNPAIDHVCVNIPSSVWSTDWDDDDDYDGHWQEVYVRISNSKFPEGSIDHSQCENGDCDTDWNYNPGGVAFIIGYGSAPTLNNMTEQELKDKIDDYLFDWGYADDDDRNTYPFESRRLITTNPDTKRIVGHKQQTFTLAQGTYPITWKELNPTNGSGNPNASRLKNNSKRLELLDDDGGDTNQSVEILDITVDNVNTKEELDNPKVPCTNIYGSLEISWTVTGTYDVLTGVATPSDPTFSFSGQASGSDLVEPVQTTTYTITASNQGAADVDSLTIL